MKTLKKLLLSLLLLTATMGLGQLSNIESFGNSSVQEVDASTLNIHLDVPVVSKPGVGGEFEVAAKINNMGFVRLHDYAGVSYWGVQGVGGTAVFGSLQSVYFDCTGQGTYVTAYTGYIDPDGHTHTIPNPPIVPAGPCGGTNNYSALIPDGSGLTVNISSTASATVVTKEGKVFTPSGGVPGTPTNPFPAPAGQPTIYTLTSTDTNSNVISELVTIQPCGNGCNTEVSSAAFTDTLGGNPLTVNHSFVTTGNRGCQAGDSNTSTYPTSTGTATVSLNCMPATITTNFGCPNVREYSSGAGLGTLLQSIVLGDGSSYQFTYEPTPNVSGAFTGRIASITYPNGRVVNYTYTGPYGGVNCYDGTAAGLTRSDATGMYTFTRSTSSCTDGSCPWSTTTVTSPSPANNATVYTFSQQTTGLLLRFVTQKVQYQGSSTLLDTVVNCYNGNLVNCATASAPTLPITQEDDYHTVPGVSSARLTTKYDSYGNTTETDTYGFGASSPTFKTTPLNYGKSWNGASCVLIGNGVNSAPCQVETFDVSGNPIGNAYFTYDSKGRVLTTSTWASGALSGGKYLTTYFIRDANGLVNKITDANGNVTTISNTSCNNGMPTSVVVASLLSSSLQYDAGCAGAKVTSVNGFDGNSTLAAYSDPLWRTTSTTDALGNTLNISYSPTTVEESESYNGGAALYDAYEKIDLTNLISYAQIERGPGLNWDTTQSSTVWDGTGVKTTTLMPCSAAKGSGCSTPASTTTHDALGRPLVETDGGGGTITSAYTGRDVLKTNGPAPTGEVVKQVRTEYDGLGRLLSVCALSSASGSVSCGQDSGGTGFLTTYNYNNAGKVSSIVQKDSLHSQTKSFTYDVAGRVLTATYPESGMTQYFYDVAPSTPGVACSPATFNGQLVKTYDANGNTTCYAYDGANRITSVTYTGPNDDGNNKYFVYDSAVVNGVTMTGTMSHLAEAYTAPTAGGTKVTDEGFSYTARGETSDVYQSSPHSGGYYHTSATYFENGAVKVLSGVPGQSAWTYSIDGKGRPYSAIQSTSVSIVNSVTYNSSDQPLVVGLGLGDSDTYTHQGATGKMSSYTFTIGATPVSIVGNLTWNANGTLRQLAVTDGINAGGTQTCKYGTSSTPGYDELGRLVSVDCGATIWQQNFSYDAFNNVTKTVPTGGTGISWQPGYDASNNHYTLGGTSYDSTGQLLTDTFHTYTWNQDHKTASVVDAGVTLTYDALDNLVEKNTGGVYTETLYSPVGRTATMSGQTTTTWLLPMPGGAKASTGIKFYHHDWLGSTRLLSSKAGRSSVADRAYAPYGEVYSSFGTSAGINFTGDNQDIVTGLSTLRIEN